MAFIVPLVAAISADLVAILAAKELPPLVDGEILLGRQHVFEASAPPRVVFIPIDGDCTIGESRYGASTPEELRPQNIALPLGTQEEFFEVHVWGQADPPHPNNDFSAAEELAEDVKRIAALKRPGGVRYFRAGPKWPDQQATASQLNKAGHEIVFGLAFRHPLTNYPLEYVPEGTTANPTFGMRVPGGSPTPEPP